MRLVPKYLRVVDNTKYNIISHGTLYTDAASRDVGYVELNDEVVRFSSVASG